jgi:hypothetical protein
LYALHKELSITRQALERNAEQGGVAALAAEGLDEKSKTTAKKGMKSTHRGTADASATENDGPKTDPEMFQQQRSDKSVQCQQLINAQPTEKHDPIGRSANSDASGLMVAQQM